MPTTSFDKESIKQSIIGKLQRYNGRTVAEATPQQIYKALASTVRDQMSGRFSMTQTSAASRIYYTRLKGNEIMLTSKQRAYLRGIAAKEDTIFQVGKGGIGENLIDQVRDALKAREIVKIKVLDAAMLSAAEPRRRCCPRWTF